MLIFLCLFFSISLHASEEISKTENSSTYFDSPGKTEFSKKNFGANPKRPRDEQEELSSKKVKKSKESCGTTSSTQFQGKSLAEMRALMKTIPYTLSSDALTIRKNPLDIQALGVQSPKVQNLIKGATNFRITTSCRQQSDLEKPQAKIKYETIVKALTKVLKSYQPEIQQERHAQAIKSFITDEITAGRTDFYRRIGRTVVTTNPLPIPTNHFHRFENLNPQPTAASRKLFNDLFAMEQAMICDDNFAASQGVTLYNRLFKDYKSLKPSLSIQAQKYASASLESIRRTLEEPNPGQTYFDKWSKKKPAPQQNK